jgi:hypothetical protein
MTLPLLLLTALMVPPESWLVGGWAHGKSSCGSDDGIRFETDGTYSELDGEGIWSLAGSRLTVRSTSGDDFGRSDVVHVTVRSTIEMELEWPDGTRLKFHRCMQGP